MVTIYGTIMALQRIKPRVEVEIIRNGKTIWKFKRKRDLLVWRGQMILAYLLSQGAIGTPTDTWLAVASENDVLPDMSDDSGDPELNEFYPLVGTSVAVSYTFAPDVKPSGAYQVYATLTIEGTVISTGNKTLRKVGIIDSVPVANRHIIVEDSVVPQTVILNDQILVRYIIQFG